MALSAAHLNSEVILVVSVAIGIIIISLFAPPPYPLPPFSPSLISLMVTVDVEHHVYFLTYFVKCCAEDAETSDTYCVIEVLSKITTLLCLAVSFYFRPVSFYFRPVSRPFSLGLDRAYRLA